MFLLLFNSTFECFDAIYYNAAGLVCSALSLSTRPHITQTLTKRQQTCRCSKVNMVNSGILELVSTILVIQHSVKYLGVKSQQFHLIHL